jgi:putative secretion ATPase (PEP-CTERM system associated)
MYETFYGLTGKPFQLNPDPSFYFGSKGHSSAYSYLKYGVFQGEGFIVITGEIGAGKTTLVRTLLAELDPRKVVAVQLVSTQLDADDLLRSVATAFGLPVKGADKAHLLATLEAFLTSLVAENKRALLIVDEAQNLTPRAMEELRMLSNFQLGDRALLQSFLVGQPELRSLLREPYMQQLRQRVIASYHLGPIDREETRAYIEHRLRRVSWKNDPEIEPAAYESIYGATGGVPRRINAVCNRLLLAAYLAEKHLIARADVEAVAAEIRDEAGGDVPLSGDRGAQNLQDVARSESVVRPFAVSAINARLDRLEKAINQVLEILRTIAPERKPTKTNRQARG